jgi:hypothetical protein
MVNGDSDEKKHEHCSVLFCSWFNKIPFTRDSDRHANTSFV